MEDVRRFRAALNNREGSGASLLRLRAARPAISRGLDLVSSLLFRGRRTYAPSSQRSVGTVNPTSKQYRPRDQAQTTPAAGADRVGTFIPASCPIAPVFPAECDASNESEGPAKHRSVPSAMRQFIHVCPYLAWCSPDSVGLRFCAA